MKPDDPITDATWRELFVSDVANTTPESEFRLCWYGGHVELDAFGEGEAATHYRMKVPINTVGELQTLAKLLGIRMKPPRMSDERLREIKSHLAWRKLYSQFSGVSSTDKVIEDLLMEVKRVRE